MTTFIPTAIRTFTRSRCREPQTATLVFQILHKPAMTAHFGQHILEPHQPLAGQNGP